MRVLLTGAFGNIGPYVIPRLLEKGHAVRCYDIKTKKSIKNERRFAGRVETVWGDLRDEKSVLAAVDGQDVIIHLAYIIPPSSESRPSWAYGINVGGTANLISAAKKQPNPPKFIFASSIAVYGATQHLAPPRKASDPANPLDNYGRHKVECERLVKESGLEWAILRLAAAPSIDLERIDPIMFDVPLEDRIEFVHPADIAVALANAIDAPEVWGRIFLIGGGERCRILQREFVEKSLDMLGIGMLPKSAFGHEHYHTDWMDTAESQRILKYQFHTFDDFLREQAALFGWKIHLMRLMRPLVRAILLMKSPYFPSRLNCLFHGKYLLDSKKVAIVTGASSGIGAAVALRLACEGVKVVLAARRKERIDAISEEIRKVGGEAHAVVADLRKESERIMLVNEAREKYGKVDILINCAGFGWYGYGYDMPWDTARDMLEVNAAALVHLSLMLLPEMKRRNSGCIINVSSIAGSLPSQGIALYSATKSFIDSFSKSLIREVRGTGLHVGVIKPGAVVTEFYNAAAQKYASLPIPAEKLGIGVEKVADKILRMIKEKRRIAYIPSFLVFVPLVELYFGWLMNLLGPLLLRRRREKLDAGKA